MPGRRRCAASTSAPVPEGVRWLSLIAALDIVVPGRRAVPSHAQVETITFDGVGHLGMLVSRQVIGCIAAELCAQRTVGEERMPALPIASLMTERRYRLNAVLLVDEVRRMPALQTNICAPAGGRGRMVSGSHAQVATILPPWCLAGGSS